ncbi:sporulation-specific protein 22 [Didymosphaeria variabile]|uniref:Sporulation-specific protein 22 n=1 Tax=Didymosphaeria variabile TaxID=1932322 RepID=A0A9W8XRY5_9PLEO|nr:sporulation-specific protein 22 [Didymosphaeria variabile]KAJ4356283.1 sporulation-specific protein 22 [Didymosphaeria variabile]
MAPFHATARAEREKKIKSVCSFASGLPDRLSTSPDETLAEDLQDQIRGLPLAASSVVAAQQDELEKLGTELWNTSTRLRRDLSHTNGRASEEASRKYHEAGLLRVFSFLLLDSAGSQSIQGRERKNCIRLMKIALKAARWCIENKEVGNATKVLERAAEYQEMLAQEGENERNEAEWGARLRVEYYALRTALAWRSDRLDTAEHMFTKCNHLSRFLTASLAEGIADLFYEIGKDLLSKRDCEASTRWFERAHDILEEQRLEMLSAEAGELKVSIMHSIVQAYLKLKTADARTKAWHMLQLLEADHEGKMSVSLLRLDLLYSETQVDAEKVYLVLHRVIRFVVLNERNVKTILHHVHKLKDHNTVTSCKVIDELICTRLFREEKAAWIEKAVITRIWITCTTHVAEGTLYQLLGLFDEVLRNVQAPFSAQVTHAAQTLLWKQIEATSSLGQHEEAEAWCGICLHSLFDMAGEINRSKIARSLTRNWCMQVPLLTSNRKMIMCTMARHDYAAAREIFSKMSDIGREDRMTRYMMYKVALHGNYPDFAALEKLLEKYNDQVPTGVHLPALLRMTVRLLMSEQIKNGVFQKDIFEQICRTFEGASAHAKASRRRPSNPSRQQFNVGEIEWFSKNSYNLAIKYCAEVQPTSLVRLLTACIEFVKLLKDFNHAQEKDGDYCLRLMFLHYLSVCAFTTLARAEDSMQACIQNYLQVSKHGREFRFVGADFVDKLRGSSKADMTAKHVQVVKLELEAALKREQWEELDDLFEECWRYGEPQHYDTLADLVLIMYSSLSKDNVDGKYQTKVLSALQKIINASGKTAGFDIVKMSRWIRCLFQLALTYDETVSLKCLEHATRIASGRKGTPSHMPETPPATSPYASMDFDIARTDHDAKELNRYPTTELEWLATTAFNHAVDYYVQEKDEKCKLWAEKALMLADWGEDGNRLRDALMDKYKGLTWDDED